MKMFVKNVPPIRRLDQPILVPQKDVAWASKMVLNPTVYRRSGESRIHMLFRASGPEAISVTPQKNSLFPICLGYAWSDDGGKNWQADFQNPALYPRLAETEADIGIRNSTNMLELNYANGCIEDPRLFQIGETLYLSVACRIFAPGAYWLKDDPMQCAPIWAHSSNASGGRAVSENVTVTVLYTVNLDALSSRRYEDAFEYLGPLSDPELGDNRDVFLFPEKLTVDNEEQYILLHRPKEPEHFSVNIDKPSIFISTAHRLESLAIQQRESRLLAAPRFPWESDRIGASTPPVRIDSTRWLLPYHGKQNDKVGYTQSFMILEDQPNALPVVRHRCSERIFIAEQNWELTGNFTTPCVFTCGVLVDGDDLMMTYGAADTVCGVAWIPMAELINFVEQFNAEGKPC